MNIKLIAKINTIKNTAIRDRLKTLSKYVTDGCLQSIIDYIIFLEEKINE